MLGEGAGVGTGLGAEGCRRCPRAQDAGTFDGSVLAELPVRRLDAHGLLGRRAYICIDTHYAGFQSAPRLAGVEVYALYASAQVSKYVSKY